MRACDFTPAHPLIQAAVAEMKATILERFPSATFDVVEGYEPEGIWLRTTVDIDDPDEVMDLVIDRVLELQIEHGLPFHVMPVPTLERSRAIWAEQDARRAAAALPR